MDYCSESILRQLDPRVYERAAERVLKGNKNNRDYFSCNSILEEVPAAQFPGLYQRVYQEHFGPRYKDGSFAERDRWHTGAPIGNIKYAPRPVRAHPFWDRRTSTPSLQQARADALLMMAAIVRAAKQ